MYRLHIDSDQNTFRRFYDMGEDSLHPQLATLKLFAAKVEIIMNLLVICNTPTQSSTLRSCRATNISEFESHEVYFLFPGDIAKQKMYILAKRDGKRA